MLKHFRISAGLLLTLALACGQIVAGAAARQGGPVEFNLRTVDGGQISSGMRRGDVLVLAFGASWLPLSRAQVQGVQKLADEYRDRDVRVYWVSVESDAPKSKNYATDEQLRSFAGRNGLKVAVLRDPDGALFKTLGVQRNQLPSIIILDRTGGVAELIGGLDPDGNLVQQLSGRINKLL